MFMTSNLPDEIAGAAREPICSTAVGVFAPPARRVVDHFLKDFQSNREPTATPFLHRSNMADRAKVAGVS